MKQTHALVLAASAVTLFAGAVYAILRIAHVSEPASITVHGATGRRLWATAAVGLGLAGSIVGGLAAARPAGRLGNAYGRLAAVATGISRQSTASWF